MKEMKESGLLICIEESIANIIRSIGVKRRGIDHKYSKLIGLQMCEEA